MILLDVAMGPVYAIMAGSFLIFAAIVAVIVLVAVKLIKKAIDKGGK